MDALEYCLDRGRIHWAALRKHNRAIGRPTFGMLSIVLLPKVMSRKPMR